MVWREAPIRQVLAAFSAFTGKSIVATDAVTGTVTTEINDQPWDVALQRILADLGLASTTDDEGDILVDVASAGAVALRAARTRRERQLAIQRLQMLVNEISQGAEANIEALEAIPAARESVELRAILEDLVEARSELRALRDRYDDDYPRIQELLANIETIETQAVPRVLTGIISSLDRRTSGAQ